jgi:hypothetical protein
VVFRNKKSRWIYSRIFIFSSEAPFDKLRERLYAQMFTLFNICGMILLFKAPLPE